MSVLTADRLAGEFTDVPPVTVPEWMADMVAGQRADSVTERSMLEQVTVGRLPVGLAARRNTRFDPTYGYVWHRIEVYPTGQDPAAYQPFGPGAMACVQWSVTHGGFVVHRMGPWSASYLQAAGQVCVYATGTEALRKAMDAVRWETDKQHNWA